VQYATSCVRPWSVCACVHGLCVHASMVCVCVRLRACLDMYARWGYRRRSLFAWQDLLPGRFISQVEMQMADGSRVGRGRGAGRKPSLRQNRNMSSVFDQSEHGALAAGTSKNLRLIFLGIRLEGFKCYLAASS